MINSYYLLQNGQQTGPYTQYELMDLGLDTQTMVLSPLSQDWQEAADLPEFAIYFETLGVFVPTKANYASFWWRLLAYLIDYVFLLIILALLIVTATVFYMFIIGSPGAPEIDKFVEDNDKISNLLGIFTFLLYNVICEATLLRGTFGKKICRLAVVDIHGKRIDFGKALSRNLGKILSSLIVGMGFLNILWDDKRQAWHDQLAKTYVIRKRD